MPLPVDTIISAFKNLHTVVITAFGNNKIQTNNNQRVYNNCTVLDLSHMTPETAAAFAKELLKAKDKSVPILATEFSEETKGLEDAIKRQNTGDMLGFFKDKITANDYDALRIALYVRASFKAGERKKVSQLKMQLVSKYGRRAANISNLCSAGYFEEVIKPLYEDMAKRYSGLDLQQRFINAFDDIVENEPFAVFVNSDMTIDLIEKEIKDKLEHFTRYGIRVLNIHGIGKSNINAITSTIESMIEDGQLYGFERNTETTDSVILVRLRKKNE